MNLESGCTSSLKEMMIRTYLKLPEQYAQGCELPTVSAQEDAERIATRCYRAVTRHVCATLAHREQKRDRALVVVDGSTVSVLAGYRY